MVDAGAEAGVEASQHGRGCGRARSRRRPCPTAISAALMPTTPPPMTTTLAGCHAGHAAEQHARARPAAFSRQWAPACTAIRPATSLIGASSGRPPSGVGDGLVGDAHRAAGDADRAACSGSGGQVQVGEQDLAGAQHGAAPPPAAP